MLELATLTKLPFDVRELASTLEDLTNMVQSMLVDDGLRPRDLRK